MEKRKYTFYDRYQKVKYANITAEELEVLNISYNKEHYMFDQQHQRNNTVLFCGLESENGCATDFIADSGRDIASDITTEIFFKELFSDLTEKEKKIVSDYFIMGKQVKERGSAAGLHFLFAIIRKTLLSSLFHACVLFNMLCFSASFTL